MLQTSFKELDSLMENFYIQLKGALEDLENYKYSDKTADTEYFGSVSLGSLVEDFDHEMHRVFNLLNKLNRELAMDVNVLDVDAVKFFCNRIKRRIDRLYILSTSISDILNLGRKPVSEVGVFSIWREIYSLVKSEVLSY